MSDDSRIPRLVSDAPENVRDVLHGDITPAEGLARLLAREQKAEYPQELFP